MSRLMNRAIKRSLQSEYRRQTQRRTKSSVTGSTRAAQASGGSAVTIAGQTFPGSGVSAPAGTTVAVKNIGRLSNAVYVPDRASSVAYSVVSHPGGGGGGGGSSLTAGAGLQIIGDEISLKPIASAGLEASGLGAAVKLRPSFGLGHHADGIYIIKPATSGLTLGAGGLAVGAGNGIEVQATAVAVKPKTTSGLHLDSTGLSVGGGAGITVSTDFIAVRLRASNPGLAFAGNDLHLGVPVAPLTWETTGQVTGTSHTHEITTSATVGLFPASVILRANAGDLELRELSLYGDLWFKGAFDRYIRAQQSLYLRPDTHLVLDPGGPLSLNSLVLLGSETVVTETPGQELRTPVYSDSITGIGGLRLWDRGGNVRQLTIGAIKADELFVRVFTADEARVNRGEEFWSRSFGIVETAFDVPEIGVNVDVWFEEAPGLAEFALFAAGNWIQIRSLDWEGLGGAGPLIVQKIWFKVVDGGSGNGYIQRQDEVAGSETVQSKPSRQQWRLTRMSGGFTGTTLKPGIVAVDFGKPRLATGGHANQAPGQGVIYLSALAQDGGPFIQIERFEEVVASVPQFFNLVRMGNINGVLDYTADTYGLAAGNNLGVVPSLQYSAFKGFTIEATNGLRLFNTDIRLYEAGILAGHINQDIGIRFLHDTAPDRTSTPRAIGWHTNINDVAGLATQPYATIMSYNVTGGTYAGTILDIDAASPAANAAVGTSIFMTAHGYNNETATLRLSTKPHGVGVNIAAVDWAGTWAQIFADQVHLSKRVLVADQSLPDSIRATGALSTLEVRETTSSQSTLAGLTISQYGAADAVMRWRLPGDGVYFTMGIDNSASDALKISRSDFLGTNDLMVFDRFEDRVSLRGRIEITRTLGGAAAVRSYSYTTAPWSHFHSHALGTEEAPAHLQDGAVIMLIGGTGWTTGGAGAGWKSTHGGEIALRATEAYNTGTEGKGGAEWVIHTHKNGGLAAYAMRLTLGPEGVDFGLNDFGQSIVRWNSPTGAKFSMSLNRDLDDDWYLSAGYDWLNNPVMAVEHTTGNVSFYNRVNINDDLHVSQNVYVTGQLRTSTLIATGGIINYMGDLHISGTITAGGVVIASGGGGAVHTPASAGDGISVTGDQVINVNSSVVRTSRSITAGAGLTGGGSLAVNLSLAVGAGDGIVVTDDAVSVASDVVRASRIITAGNGLTGGGTLAGDRTLNVGAGDGITVGTDSVAVDSSVARTSRIIGAGDGLTGGGTLAADLTLNVATGDGLQIVSDAVAVDSSVVRTSRTIATSGALAGGGTLAADRTLSLTLVANSALLQTTGLGVNPAIAGLGLAWLNGVINVNAGHGIAISGDDVTVNLPADSGLAKDSTGLYASDWLAGTGLTMTSRKLNVIALSTGGLQVNEDSIQVKLPGPSGLETDATGLFVSESIAGSGLSMTGRVLNINVKEGVEVDGDALRVDEDYDYTWVGSHVFSGPSLAFQVDPQVSANIDFVGGVARTITADTDLTIIPSDDLLLTPGGDLRFDPTGGVYLPDAQTFRSDTFADLPTGISGFSLYQNLDGSRQLTINKLKTDEQYARVFVSDETRIDRGEEFWAKSYGVVETGFLVPADEALVDVWFENAPGAGPDPLFEVEDWILIRLIDWVTSLVIEKIWFQAYSLQVAGTVDGYRQQWRLRRKSGGTEGQLIRAGITVLDAGKVGQGWVHLSALVQDGGPFVQLGTFDSVIADVPQYINRVRIGNLNNIGGIVGNHWGIAAGNDLGLPVETFSGYTIEDSLGMKMYNTDIELFSGGSKVVKLSKDEGLTFALFPTAQPFNTIEWRDDIDDDHVDPHRHIYMMATAPDADSIIMFLQASGATDHNELAFTAHAFDNSQWTDFRLTNKGYALSYVVDDVVEGTIYAALSANEVSPGRLRAGIETSYSYAISSTFEVNDNIDGAGATQGLTIFNMSDIGDVLLHWRGFNVEYWTMGIDRSNSNALVIADTTSLGTSADVLVITKTGHLGVGKTPAYSLDVSSYVAKATASTVNVANFGSSDAANGLGLLIQQVGSATAAIRHMIVQSLEHGVAYRNLLINPYGGNVAIGGHTAPVGKLFIESATVGDTFINLYSTVGHTYTGASPSGAVIFNSHYAGIGTPWNTARMNWGYAAHLGSAGARWGIDIINTLGNWHNAITVAGNGGLGINNTDPQAFIHANGAPASSSLGQSPILRFTRPLVNAVSYNQEFVISMGRYLQDLVSASALTRVDLELNNAAGEYPVAAMSLFGNGTAQIYGNSTLAGGFVPGASTTLLLGKSDGSRFGQLNLYGTTAGYYSTIMTTTVNLHIDPPSLGDMYLGWLHPNRFIVLNGQGGPVTIGTSVQHDSVSPLTVVGSAAAYVSIKSPGTGQVGVQLIRTGGTASQWFAYMPTGTTDMAFYQGSFGTVMTLKADASVRIPGRSGSGGVYFFSFSAMGTPSPGIILCSGISRGCKIIFFYALDTAAGDNIAGIADLSVSGPYASSAQYTIGGHTTHRFYLSGGDLYFMRFAGPGSAYGNAQIVAY